MILIADDNANVRRMIRSLIEEIDPKMLECADDEESIEAYGPRHGSTRIQR